MSFFVRGLWTFPAISLGQLVGPEEICFLRNAILAASGIILRSLEFTWKVLPEENIDLDLNLLSNLLLEDHMSVDLPDSRIALEDRSLGKDTAAPTIMKGLSIGVHQVIGDNRNIDDVEVPLQIIGNLVACKERDKDAINLLFGKSILKDTWNIFQAFNVIVEDLDATFSTETDEATDSSTADVGLLEGKGKETLCILYI